MGASAVAAWYAAVVATILLIWDIIKWRKAGPQLKGEASSNFRSFGMGGLDGKRLTMLRVSNVGDRPTTMITWGMYWYPAGASLENTKSRECRAIVRNIGGYDSLPIKLKPGDYWVGMIEETDDYLAALKNGTVMFGMGCSHSDEELMIKVKKSETVQNDAMIDGK